LIGLLLFLYLVELPSFAVLLLHCVRLFFNLFRRLAFHERIGLNIDLERSRSLRLSFESSFRKFRLILVDQGVLSLLHGGYTSCHILVDCRPLHFDCFLYAHVLVDLEDALIDQAFAGEDPFALSLHVLDLFLLEL